MGRRTAFGVGADGILNEGDDQAEGQTEVEKVNKEATERKETRK